MEDTSENQSNLTSAPGDNISVGASSYNALNQQYQQRKYQIELNIKLLYISDPKYFN